MSVNGNDFTGEPPLFEGGPFPHVQKSLGLFRPVGRNIGVRTALVILLSWAPLVVLTIAQSLSGNLHLAASFFTDMAVHSRSLIVVALFILCEPICLSRLQKIVSYFVVSGTIREADRPQFNDLIASAKRIANSTVVEVVVIAGCYALLWPVSRLAPLDKIPAWYSVTQNGQTSISWAGRWYLLVSMPLFLILLLGWIIRVALWGWFLHRVSRMRMRLIAAHPDLAAGLMFLNEGLFAFMPLGFTFGVFAAGSLVNRVAQGASLLTIEKVVAGLVVFVLILFVGPLLVFALNLHHAKVAGVYDYGELADAVGSQFEAKWLGPGKEVDPEVLQVQDFSATTDLYQVVSNVHQMRLVPFEVRAMISLVVVTLIPFIPVVLMVIPFKVILDEVVHLLF